jgi:hypothetical protein
MKEEEGFFCFNNNKNKPTTTPAMFSHLKKESICGGRYITPQARRCALLPGLASWRGFFFSLPGTNTFLLV